MRKEGLQEPARRPRAAGLVMALLLIATVGVALGASLWTRDLVVKEVRVGGNRIVSSGEIYALAAIPKNHRLYEVDLNSARKRVLANQFFRGVSVNRDVPDRISITVDERVPIAAIAGERMLYIDADRMVMPPARSEFIFDLPVLTGAIPQSECVPGKRVTSELFIEALQIVSVAQKISDDFFRLISEVHIDAGGNIEIFTSESGVPVLFGRGDVAGKMVKLDAFWNEFVHERGAQELQYIDLRFDDQVVVRWNEAKEFASHR